MWSIFPYACIILCFVSTVYLLKLACWKLALFGILHWFTAGHFLCQMSFKALWDFWLLRDLQHLFYRVSINLNQLIAPCSLSTFFFFVIMRFFSKSVRLFLFCKEIHLYPFFISPEMISYDNHLSCLTSLSMIISSFFPVTGNGIFHPC